jgi:hypothetical protein
MPCSSEVILRFYRHTFSSGQGSIDTEGALAPSTIYALRHQEEPQKKLKYPRAQDILLGHSLEGTVVRPTNGIVDQFRASGRPYRPLPGPPLTSLGNHVERPAIFYTEV